jgi:hypothetical protein
VVLIAAKVMTVLDEYLREPAHKENDADHAAFRAAALELISLRCAK